MFPALNYYNVEWEDFVKALALQSHNTKWELMKRWHFPPAYGFAPRFYETKNMLFKANCKEILRFTTQRPIVCRQLIHQRHRWANGLPAEIVVMIVSKMRRVMRPCYIVSPRDIDSVTHHETDILRFKNEKYLLNKKRIQLSVALFGK